MVYKVSQVHHNLQSNILLFHKFIQEYFNKPEEPLLKFKDSKYTRSDIISHPKMAKGRHVVFVDGTNFNSENSSYGCHKNSLKTKSMDGRIEHVEQGNVGDCWLLAAVNSLSYTEKGRKIIKKTLEYASDGIYVKFRGLDSAIFIPYNMVQAARNTLKLSACDDDMKVIELAMRKVFIEQAKGKIEGNLYPCEKNYLEGNGSLEAWKLLVGKKGNFNTISPSLLEFIRIRNDIVSVYSIEDDESNIKIDENGKKYREVTDIRTGEKTKLYANHAYSIRKINDDRTIVLINPWNNDEKGPETLVVAPEELKGGYIQYVECA